MFSAMRYDYVADVVKLKEIFNVPPDMLDAIVTEALASALQNPVQEVSHIERVVEIKNAFKVSKKILKSEEVVEAAKKGIVFELTEGNITKVIKIKKELGMTKSSLKDPEIIKAAEYGMRHLLENTKIEDARIVMNYFNFSKSVVKNIVERAISSKLYRDRIEDVVKIKNAFSDLNSDIDSPEV